MTGFSRISKRVDGLEGSTRDSMRAVIADSVKTGELTMADAIQTRGTGRTWKPGWSTSTLPNAFYGRTGSIPGRVATGEMRDLVTSSVDADSKFRVRGRFGWLRGMQAYFDLQDEGFVHSLTGQRIEGMHARRDAMEMAELEFQQGAERVAKAIADWRF